MTHDKRIKTLSESGNIPEHQVAFIYDMAYGDGRLSKENEIKSLLIDLEAMTEKFNKAVEVIKKYSEMTSLQPPSSWNSFKNGGPPELSDYEEIDMGEPAREFLKSLEEK